MRPAGRKKGTEESTKGRDRVLFGAAPFLPLPKPRGMTPAGEGEDGACKTCRFSAHP